LFIDEPTDHLGSLLTPDPSAFLWVIVFEILQDGVDVEALFGI
jgi:hypothetical protein